MGTVLLRPSLVEIARRTQAGPLVVVSVIALRAAATTSSSSLPAPRPRECCWRLNPKPMTISSCLFHIGDLQHPGIAGMSGHSEPFGNRRRMLRHHRQIRHGLLPTTVSQSGSSSCRSVQNSSLTGAPSEPYTLVPRFWYKSMSSGFLPLYMRTAIPPGLRSRWTFPERRSGSPIWEGTPNRATTRSNFCPGFGLLFGVHF